MPASPQDKFKKVGANTVTSLAAPGKNLGATSINVGSTTNYPTDTGLVIGIRIVDSNGNAMPGTYTEWNGMYDSPTSLTIENTPVYGTDQVYGAGATTQVFLMVSSSLHNQMIDGLLVSHDQDGKLKAGAISNSNMLANNTVTTPAITDASVTADKLANGTTIASTKKTSNFIKSSTTIEEVTGFDTTFTVPTGGANYKITLYVGSVDAAAINTPALSLWDGGVNSGTLLAYGRSTIHAATYGTIFNVIWHGNLAAGSHTIRAGLSCTAPATITFLMASTNPGLLLVEKA